MKRCLTILSHSLDEKIEDLKKLTNFENTKKVLDNIKLELPDVPDINDIKIIKLNREKVENEIIKPKDKLINELYQDNKNLYRELSKQVNLDEINEQIKKLESSVERRKNLLSNENYLNKAPKELVEKEKNTLKDEEEKLAKLKNE